MNYNQWKSHAAKGSVSKVTYCCGDEVTLIELVIDEIRSLLQVPVTDYMEYDASRDTSFWEAASSYPLNYNANRLVVVRNAEGITDWNHLYDWMLHTKGMTNNYLLFISYQSDAASLYEKGKRTGYVEHIDYIRTKGKFIKCSTPNIEDLIKWIKLYGLTDRSAQHLVERTSADVDSIYDVLMKVKVWSASPSTAALDLLCAEQALDPFTDYLILRDKKSAYLALQSMPDSEKMKIIGKLDARLDMLTEVGKLLRRRMYAGDIAAATGIKIFLVKKFSNVAKDYDFEKIKYCRQLITMVDAAVRDGVKTGLWETLIALW